MSQEPQKDLTVYSQEQEAQANNPYRKISRKLLEMAGRESLSAEDRQALQGLEQQFRQQQHELNLRAQYLLDQGIDPSANPGLFFDLCYDNRNSVFLPGGILISNHDLENPTKGKNFVSPKTAGILLEELGFIAPGESLQGVVDKIGGEWKQDPRFNGYFYEKQDPNSLARVNCYFKTDASPESATIWIENQSLGPGVIAGIRAPLLKNAEGKAFVGDTLSSLIIRVEGKDIADNGKNLLRCAP